MPLHITILNMIFAGYSMRWQRLHPSVNKRWIYCEVVKHLAVMLFDTIWGDFILCKQLFL